MTGAGLGYASIFSFENATSPAAQKTTRPSTMIALRVRPNSSTDFIKSPPGDRRYVALGGLAVGSQQKLVAEKDRAVGDNQFSGLQTLQDLTPAALLLDTHL